MAFLREMGGAASNLSGPSDPPRQGACRTKRPRNSQMWCLGSQGIAAVVPMAKAPPTVGEWNMFYARFIRLVSKYKRPTDDAGKLTRRLHRRNGSSVAVSQGSRVARTNNHAGTPPALWLCCGEKPALAPSARRADVLRNESSPCARPAGLRGKRIFPVLVDRHDLPSSLATSPETAWIQEAKN